MSDVVTIRLDDEPIRLRMFDANTLEARAMAEAAELAANSALAGSRYFTSQAAGEAGSTTGQFFTHPDGSGGLVFRERTAGGSTVIANAATAVQLALKVATTDLAYRTPLAEGATGDGTADDSDETIAAIATGKAVELRRDKTFAVTGNVSGFADRQRIYGGGTLLKKGTTLTPIVAPADGLNGLWFDDVGFDGAAENFVNGNPVSAIISHLATRTRVTFSHFSNLIDSAAKIRDGMHGLFVGNLIEGCDENALEIYNYPADPRLSNFDPENLDLVPYVADRPRYEGGHIVALNQLRDITRYEGPSGPIVDASCVAIAGAEGYGQKLIVDIGNVTEDTQHHHWFENNAPNSEMDAAVVVANVGWGGLSGDTGDGIYGKAFLGFVGCKNSLAIGNVGRNAGNHLVEGTITAFVKISGGATTETATKAVNNGLIVSHNAFEDDTGVAERTQYGIHADKGRRMLIAHNLVQGAAERQVHLYGDDPDEDTIGNLLDVACYGNMGAENDYSWHQPMQVAAVRQSLDTTGTQTALFNAFDDEYPLPCACRLVGVVVQLVSSIGAGSLEVRALIAGVEDTAMRLRFGPVDGAHPENITGARFSLLRASLDADQLVALQRVKFQTVAAGIAGGNSASIYGIFDLGMKR